MFNFLQHLCFRIRRLMWPTPSWPLTYRMSHGLILQLMSEAGFNVVSYGLDGYVRMINQSSCYPTAAELTGISELLSEYATRTAQRNSVHQFLEEYV